MDVKEEDVFPPAPEDLVQDKMLNWVIRGVTLDQSYKKEDYVPIDKHRFKGLQQFTYSAGAHPEAYPIDVYVYNLGGLEYATDLRKIDLSYNKVSDLSPLKDLTNLRDLTFYMNELTDISPLKNLANLELLNISFNEVKDLHALNDMQKLRNFNASNNGISDITGIERCTSLSALDLSDNKVKDISAMKNLTNMEKMLWLNNNEISDISALAGMTKLKDLDLFGNQISDISALKNLRNLQSLNLGNNEGISDIAPLVNLTDLDESKVSLNGTKIETKKELLFTVIEVNKILDRFNANDISVVDKGKVEEARKAYEKLSDEAKGYVSELRIRAAEENIARIENGQDIVHYEELEEFENMAKQDVKTLEVRVTDKNGTPVRHARYKVKGQSYGNVYGEISTDKYGLAEFEIPLGSNEMTYTLELQEHPKFTGMTEGIKITVSEDGVITHINGKPTEDGKIDILLTLKEGEQLSVNKVTLKQAIDSANKINKEDYTENSYKKLTTAVEKAKNVLDDSSVTQKEVDQAEADIWAAIDKLEKGADLRTLFVTAIDEDGEAVPEIHFVVSNSWNGGRTELISDAEGKFQYTVPKHPINYYTLNINSDENYTMIDGGLSFEESNNKIVNVGGKPVAGPEDLNVTVTLKKKENVKPVDKSALEELVKEAEELRAEDYTEDSYAALQIQLEEARKVLIDEKVSQATVNSRKIALQKAIDALIMNEVKPIDMQTIVILVKDESGKPVKGVKFGGYSSYGMEKQHMTDSRGAIIYKTASWETIDIGLQDDRYTYTTGSQVITVSNEDGVIISINGNEVTSLENLVVNVTVKKAGGEEQPVDKSGLEAKIREALEVDESKYTEESYAKLAAALVEAQEVFDRTDASQEEVNAQVEKLAVVIKGLVEKPNKPVDKTRLEEKLEEAKEIQPDGYTASSYAALQNAIKEAEIVLNGTPSQDEVFRATINLQKAIDELKKVSTDVNKELLKEKLDKARNYNAYDWTKESFAALQAAIEEAEAVYDDPNATQVDVDRKVAVLNKAIAGLTEKGELTIDKTVLEKLVAEAKAIKKGNYTDDSWNVLQKAIKVAETILVDDNTTQEAVDTQVKALENAVEALEENQPSKPEDSTKPVIQENSNGSDDIANKETPSESASPKTGDTTQSFIYVIGMLVAVGMGAIVFRRKSKVIETMKKSL